jgi:uncharacterized protein YraI
MRVVILLVLVVAFVLAEKTTVESDSATLLALLLAGMPETESDTEAALCASSNLNVRSGACTDKQILKTIPAGTAVTKIADAGSSCGYSWSKVSAGGVTGFVATNFLGACSGSSSNGNSGNPGFKYDYASQCSGGPSKGAQNLLSFLQSSFPGGRNGGIYNCRSVRGGSNLSLHGEGRAVDYMLNVNNAKEKAIGDRIVAHFVNNPENAKKFGVQEVIFNRKIWTAFKPTAGMQPYNGENPHTDHVHIGLNKWGASNCCK